MFDAPLQSLINGQQAAHISIRDRGFQYGDGCFETIRVISRRLILGSAHFTRLRQACEALHLTVNFNLLDEDIALLLQAHTAVDAVLKITITRGEGGRGYGPAEQANCTRIVQLIDYVPPATNKGAQVAICQHRLSSNAYLGGIKHLNRLDQVLASAQIPADCDEGLCMDEADCIIEGCRSNLLLSLDDQLLTPCTNKSGVEGVMLNHLINEFAKQGKAVIKEAITLSELKRASEILLCNSVFGIWPVAEIKNENWRAGEREALFSNAAMEIHNDLFSNCNI